MDAPCRVLVLRPIAGLICASVPAVFGSIGRVRVTPGTTLDVTYGSGAGSGGGVPNAIVAAATDEMIQATARVIDQNDLLDQGNDGAVNSQFKEREETAATGADDSTSGATSQKRPTECR